MSELPATALTHRLPNGVQVVCLPMPGRQTAAVAIYLRSGSAHEDRAHNGISHVLEHMAFKGTRTRDVHRVNLDAERLGAEVNAHTDKDHTAYTMHGMAADAPRLVTMLADIVCNATFPDDELAREREVLLQELAEVEDDPVAVGYQLFDQACWGGQSAALPVIGQRKLIERVSRADLADFVARQYSGCNTVLVAAGAIDIDAVLRAAESALGGLPPGSPNALPRAVYSGGLRSKRMEGGAQTHLVLGFGVPARADDDGVGDLAAAVLGDGMSSPLLAELREKRGLVYHAACVADHYEYGGQLAIEASFAPENLEAVLGQTVQLLRLQADRVDLVDLERARKQVSVRWLRDAERTGQHAEDAALDCLQLGRPREPAARVAQLQALGAEQVRAAFERMLSAGPALALTGALGRAASRRAEAVLQGLR